MTISDDLGEQGRLTEVYGRLRLKLLDLSKKNRMLNYNLGSRSKRHLQIVDEVMDEADYGSKAAVVAEAKAKAEGKDDADVRKAARDGYNEASSKVPAPTDE